MSASHPPIPTPHGPEQTPNQTPNQQELGEAFAAMHTSGPMLVMGPRVKGGLYGKHPKLDDLEKGDMAFTTDFRRVYTDVAMGVFDAPRDVIDKRFKPFGIVRKA